MMPVTIFSLLYWTEDRRRVTEVALTLVFSESYDAFIVLLAEKRIYIFILDELHIAQKTQLYGRSYPISYAPHPNARVHAPHWDNEYILPAYP